MLLHPDPVGFDVLFRGAWEGFEDFAVGAESVVLFFID